MVTTDKPKVLGSLKSLQDKAAEVNREPARFKAGEGFITFPDPMVMDAFESDELLTFIMSPQTDSRASLKKWLSEEDFQKVVDAKLTRRALGSLMKQVQAYYDDVFASPGEDDASTS